MIATMLLKILSRWLRYLPRTEFGIACRSNRKRSKCSGRVLQKRFASGATEHHINVIEVRVQGSGGYSVAHFSVTVPQPSGPLREERGSIVAVYQLDPYGWHMRLVEPSIPENRTR